MIIINNISINKKRISYHSGDDKLLWKLPMTTWNETEATAMLSGAHRYWPESSMDALGKMSDAISVLLATRSRTDRRPWSSVYEVTTTTVDPVTDADDDDAPDAEEGDCWPRLANNIITIIISFVCVCILMKILHN